MATTKKKVVRKKAVARKPETSTSLVDIQAQLRAEAEGMGSVVGGAGSGTKVRTGGKQFTLPNGTVNPGPLSVIVLDIAYHNFFYGAEYDENNKQPPVCFGLGSPASRISGQATDEVVYPSPNSPVLQSSEGESCNVCPLNQWDSGPNKGKLCKNICRVAFLAAPPDDYDEEEVNKFLLESPILTLDISPGALKGFGGYVNKLRSAQKVLMNVISEISFNHAKAYPTVVFTSARENPPNNLVACAWRRPEAHMMLQEEPPVLAEEEAPPPKKKRVTKKKVSRRRTA